MITPEETAELERLLAKATPGPWLAFDVRGTRAVMQKRTRKQVVAWSGFDQADFKNKKSTNLALIVFLRNHATALLAAARQPEAKDARIAKLEAAINWACGCDDDGFGDELPTQAPRYWFRKELRERAGMEYDPDTGRYVAARLADPSPNAGGGGAE